MAFEFKLGYFELIAPEDEGRFATDVLGKGRRMIVWGADWCGPCRMQASNILGCRELLEPIARQVGLELPIYFIDTDKSQGQVQRKLNLQDLSAIPYTIILDGWNRMERYVGAKSVQHHFIPDLKRLFGKPLLVVDARSEMHPDFDDNSPSSVREY